MNPFCANNNDDTLVRMGNENEEETHNYNDNTNMLQGEDMVP